MIYIVDTRSVAANSMVRQLMRCPGTSMVEWGEGGEGGDRGDGVQGVTNRVCFHL